MEHPEPMLYFGNGYEPVELDPVLPTTALNGGGTTWTLSGFMIRAAGLRIYFAGDTAYVPIFREIRARLGLPDLSLLPIGAYEPRWSMRVVHMNRAEAVHPDSRGILESISCRNRPVRRASSIKSNKISALQG